jgi:hypothetical protein
MNVEKLTASDFPGIDEAKFNEWKTLRLKDWRKKSIMVSLTFVVGFVLAKIMKPAGSFLIIMIPWVLIQVFGVYQEKAAKRMRQLGKELKMSARLRAKKRGLVFGG